MTRLEFAHKVAKDKGVSFAKTKPWVYDIFKSLADALVTEDEVKIPGVGTFVHVRRKARYGRHAVTGEQIYIPERTAVKFIISPALAELIRDIPVEEDCDDVDD